MAHPAPRPDASPFPDQRASTEQIGLQAKPIKPLHVLLDIDPAKLQGGWKKIELGGHMGEDTRKPDKRQRTP